MKKITNFNEYWPWIKSEAAKRGWTDSDFMKRCNVPRQRYYEFPERRSLTGTYMYRIMEGMGLTRELIEQESNCRFREDQIRELKKESWISAHQDIIDALIDNPGLVRVVQQQIALIKK